MTRIKKRPANLGQDFRVEGVKYDRVGIVLVNAVKEQQAQIRSSGQQSAVSNRQ